MKNEDILNNLKCLSEGRLLPDEWIDWWKNNEKELKNDLPLTWFLKIKPKISQGAIGATAISQNNARSYLKSIDQYFDCSSIDYTDNWKKQIDEISLDLDKMTISNFELEFKRLKQNFPRLFFAIKDNILICNVLKKGLSQDNILLSPFGKLLTKDVITFFSCISILKMEGVIIDFSLLQWRNNYIKVGEIWIYNDGDELLVKPNEEIVYLNDIGTHSIQTLNKTFHQFIEDDLSLFIEKD